MLTRSVGASFEGRAGKGVVGWSAVIVACWGLG